MTGLLIRIVAAVLGGYALANLLPLTLVGLLPMGRADAVMTALLLSFAVYVGAILWAFSTRSPLRAWVGLLLLTALVGLVLTVQRFWP